MRASDPYSKESSAFVYQFLELLGIDETRVIFVQEEVSKTVSSASSFVYIDKGVRKGHCSDCLSFLLESQGTPHSRE